MGTYQTLNSLEGFPKPGPESSTRPRRILLVDDQPFFLAMGQNMLRGAGYEIQTAPSGSEAIKRARATLPDVILLDVEMPDMDGFETCRRLKANHVTAAIPVAMLTATLDQRLTQKAYKVGAEATIPKGASAAQLRNLLQVILKTAESRRAAPRVLVAIAVEYEHGEHVTSGETLDLTEDGMFIKTSSPADVGTLLILRFALPGSPRWECSARVAWKRRPEDDHVYPAGMGVQFLDLQPEARAAIVAFSSALQLPWTPHWGTLNTPSRR